MKKKLFILIYLLVTTFSFSQQAKIDSLSHLFYSAKEDSIKVRLLAEVGEVAYSMDIELAKQKMIVYLGMQKVEVRNI